MHREDQSMISRWQEELFSISSTWFGNGSGLNLLVLCERPTCLKDGRPGSL